MFNMGIVTIVTLGTKRGTDCTIVLLTEHRNTSVRTLNKRLVILVY
jgi:hypothetical protein